MAEATYRHGTPVMIDYTPAAGAISAGQVIVIGTAGLTTVIAHSDIANSTLGAVAAGGGVYDVVNLDNAAAGAKVYWDDTNNKVTTTATNNALVGFVVELGAAGANTTTRVLHRPYV